MFNINTSPLISGTSCNQISATCQGPDNCKFSYKLNQMYEPEYITIIPGQTWYTQNINPQGYKGFEFHSISGNISPIYYGTSDQNCPNINTLFN